MKIELALSLITDCSQRHSAFVLTLENNFFFSGRSENITVFSICNAIKLFVCQGSFSIAVIFFLKVVQFNCN